MADVDRPAVHPDLLPYTLTHTHTHGAINRNIGGEEGKRRNTGAATVLSPVLTSIKIDLDSYFIKHIFPLLQHCI